MERHSLPSWAVNNPYLSILRPRFFTQPDLCDWRELPRRVTRLFQTVEARYVPLSEAQASAERLLELLLDGAFLPNSPVMMNSEQENQVNLFACHVLAPPVGADALEIASRIHDGCGGIGYDLSQVDDPVQMTAMIEAQTAQRNPGRKRKAHSAVTLQVDHPMIKSFIGVGDELTITHTNVEIGSDFFQRVIANDVPAVSVWDSICESIYRTGRPAIVFGEHTSLRSANGERLIPNVCGESLLRENESALIGSINLSRFVQQSDFDEQGFLEAVELGVRCLDNLHDLQDHASPDVARRCAESRKIGLSVMGYADALLLMGLRYGSESALLFASRVMSLLRDQARHTSELLSQVRGGCNPALLPLGSAPRRNASLMAIAANGTLSLIANVTGGIEPMFSYVIHQEVEGVVVHQLQPTLRRVLEQHGLSKQEIIHVVDELVAGADPAMLETIPPAVRRVLVRAHDLSTIEHIRTQATFQSFIDGGISKTINLPGSSSQADIAGAILEARASGCVGISLYRDGSIEDQPIQVARRKTEAAEKTA